MKSDWKFGILDDAVDKGSSNISLNKIKDDDGEFPVFGAKGFVQNVSFYQQENQYLAIIKDGAGIGRVSIHPEKSSVLATMQYILPKQSYDIKFLYYFLNSIDFNKYRTGSTIPHIYYKNYKLEPFPLVSKEEQKQIVAKLDQCFEAIDKAKANAAKNLENAKELFQSKLNDIFSQKGEGWVESTFKEICSIITDGTHQTPKYFDSGYIFLSSKNVTSGKIDWDNVKYLDEEQHNKMYKRLAPKINDILLAKNGTTGVAAIVDIDKVFDIYVSLALLRPTELIHPYYLLHFINSIKAKKQFNKRLKGSGVPNLHLKEIREVIINYPSNIAKQKEISGYIDKLMVGTKSLESKYQQELKSLEELKKSILQKAFEGELIQLK